jgi:hypothetical protein
MSIDPRVQLFLHQTGAQFTGAALSNDETQMAEVLRIANLNIDDMWHYANNAVFKTVIAQTAGAE